MSSNTKIIRDAASPREAVAMLERLTALAGHEFWPDPMTIWAAGPFASLAFVGYRQATDAYLLASAQQQGCKRDRVIAEPIVDRDERMRCVNSIEIGE